MRRIVGSTWVVPGILALLAVLGTTALADSGPPLEDAPETRTEPLTVRTTVDAAFTRTWTWSIEAQVASDRATIASGSATFDHIITLDHSPADSDLTLAGTVEVSNPGVVAAHGVDLGVTQDGTGACTVTDGTDLTVPAGETLTRDYRCRAADHDAAEVTGEATWPADPSGDAGTSTAPATVDRVVSRVDACVTVTDSLVPTRHRVRCVGDDDLELGYAVTIAGVAGTCKDVDDTATFTTADRGLTGSDTQTVSVCTGADPVATVTVAPSFARAWTWSLDASSAPPRVEVVEGSTAQADHRRTIDAASTDSAWAIDGSVKVRNPSDWQDLVVDITVTYPGADCRARDGTAVRVAAGRAVTVDLHCSFTEQPVDGTVEATVNVIEGLAPDASVTASTKVAFGAPTKETDTCVLLTDPLLPETAATAIICTGDALPVTIEHAAMLTGEPGTCVVVQDTATLMTIDTATPIPATDEVEVCVLAAPALRSAATPSFTRTHTWSIEKWVDRTLVQQAGGWVTLDYHVTVTQTGTTDGGWRLDGTLTATNPNDWTPVTLDLGVAVDDGGACTVAKASGVTLEAGATVTRDLVCTWAVAPAPSRGTLTATATSSAPVAALVTASVGFAFAAPTRVVHGQVTVTDTLEGSTWILGELRAADVAPFTTATDHYARDVGVPAKGCTSFTNIARIEQTGQSARQTTRVCGAAKVRASGA